MFTGIIEGKGKVVRVEYRAEQKRLTLEVPAHLTDVQLGDSINVSGACLTIVGIKGTTIEVDVSSETLQKTVLSDLKPGQSLNLERALKLSSRLGGHIVTGHIDGIGVIRERRKAGEFLGLRIEIPKPVSDYIVEKGSIAVDGISLTVNAFRGGEVELMLIPYTIQETTLIEKQVGDRVNVESDILGKYVAKILQRDGGGSGKIDLAFLEKHGFLNGSEADDQ